MRPSQVDVPVRMQPKLVSKVGRCFGQGTGLARGGKLVSQSKTIPCYYVSFYLLVAIAFIAPNLKISVVAVDHPGNEGS